MVVKEVIQCVAQAKPVNNTFNLEQKYSLSKSLFFDFKMRHESMRQAIGFNH